MRLKQPATVAAIKQRSIRHRLTPWVILVLGLVVLAYPTMAGYFTSQRNAAEIHDYRNQQLTDDQIAARDQAIAGYNEALAEGMFNAATDPFATDGAPPATSTYLATGELLFVLHVPSLDLQLPIYYGTSQVVLARGGGLLENTNYPGQLGGHAVVSAHRGTHDHQMFRYIDKMQPGDAIYVETTDTVLKYMTNQISLVEPQDTHVIVQQPGKDLLTLLSCHPFPVNDQRLLIHSERAEISTEEIAAINPALVPGADATTYRNLHDPGRWLTETSIGRWFLASYPVWIVVALIAVAAGVRFIWVAIGRRRKRTDDDSSASDELFATDGSADDSSAAAEPATVLGEAR